MQPRCRMGVLGEIKELQKGLAVIHNRTRNYRYDIRWVIITFILWGPPAHADRDRDPKAD